jgi:hypothetical protein
MMSPRLSIRSTGTRTPACIPPFTGSMVSGFDSICTKERAEKLAALIVHAWEIEGHKVTAWVIKLPNPSKEGGGGNNPIWAVRTDLVRGLPSGLGKFGWEAKYSRCGV